MQDYYETLGVSKTASLDEIKKSYRKLAMKYHPDRNAGDKKAEEQFKSISEAYAVLSDPEKKRQYDTVGASNFHQRYSSDDIFRGTDFNSIFHEFGMGGGGSENIFSRIFGFGGPGGGAWGEGPQQRRASRGQDVEYTLELGFEEAYKGGERQVSLSLPGGEKREFRVKVPGGIREGGRLRVSGKGTSGRGGEAGDLFLNVKIAPHPDYARNGDDIEIRLPLKISQALLGDSCEIKTVQGPKKIRVPAGVKAGTKIRLKGLGFPIMGSGSSGDFYAVVDLDVPSSLSPEQKNLAEQLRAQGL
ncbi:MAG: DnaJ domain-containing protein [Oligoflexales bacterium]|nr:DnaJ domain-containing protein [Oligoflexales bacterium]